MGSAEDRTFMVNFSGEGVGKLRERVRGKLKEFMGDYTDDTLVEYVIVLLRNGRNKEEARNELNVFLGDDSDSFISWLWDHLSSNLDLYIHSEEANISKVSKIRSTLVEKPGENEPQGRDLLSERGKSDNLSRSHHKREWKGSGRDVTELPPLLRSEVGKVSSEEKGYLKPTHARSGSPQSPHHKKRIRHDEQQPRKIDTSQQLIGASRRLLQFAVRDAVGTVRQPGTAKVQDAVDAVRQCGAHSLAPASNIGGSLSASGNGPSTKRLRSVVSTLTEDPSMVEQPRRVQSIARVPNAMDTVVRAVQEAADDVGKPRSGRSVFDRLGRDIDFVETRERATKLRKADVQNEDCEEYDQIEEQIHVHSNYLRAVNNAGSIENIRMINTEAGFTSPSTSDGEGYDDVNGIGCGDVDVPQRGLHTVNGDQNTLISQLSTATDNRDAEQISRNKEQDKPCPTPISSSKIVNGSSNALSQKPPTLELRDVGKEVVWKAVQENDPKVKFGTQMLAENNFPIVVQNQIVKPAIDVAKESQKTVPFIPGSFTAGRPLEDADSRTIFVSNVHFAATKDSLSRHFNKFGEVLKVIIVTDATTGQPKGSAYVEFMRKEAADNALSLDGTSFMSRLLKVVKRSSAHQEATTPIMWPRVARGSAYSSARFPRVPFPRGLSGGYRPRLPIKPGARSMQWKRGDAQAASIDSGALLSGQAFVSQTSRSLTYIRTESKSNGNARVA